LSKLFEIFTLCLNQFSLTSRRNQLYVLVVNIITGLYSKPVIDKPTLNRVGESLAYNAILLYRRISPIANDTLCWTERAQYFSPPRGQREGSFYFHPPANSPGAVRSVQRAIKKLRPSRLTNNRRLFRVKCSPK